ncbi:MAG TPA: hypothetical protein VI386_17375 [Candidatus Sulfotelmatobacter sp.]
MTIDNITPESIKLNEVEPEGFVAEPRILSQEVASIRQQVTALCEAVKRLVDLQSEANRKLEAALNGNPITGELQT